MSLTSIAGFHANIRSAVRARLLTLAGIPAVAWEMREYRPVKGTPYISESVRPITSTVVGVGGAPLVQHRLTANFTLHYPSGRVTTDIEAMAGAILAHFGPGTILSHADGDTVTIQQAERTPLNVEVEWTTAAVIITMQGHTVS